MRATESIGHHMALFDYAARRTLYRLDLTNPNNVIFVDNAPQPGTLGSLIQTKMASKEKEAEPYKPELTQEGWYESGSNTTYDHKQSKISALQAALNFLKAPTGENQEALRQLVADRKNKLDGYTADLCSVALRGGIIQKEIKAGNRERAEQSADKVFSDIAAAHQAEDAAVLQEKECKSARRKSERENRIDDAKQGVNDLLGIEVFKTRKAQAQITRNQASTYRRSQRRYRNPGRNEDHSGMTKN
jgi:hypothetical protein